jgi:hypothetical protein
MAARSFLLRHRSLDASSASAVARFTALVSDTDRNALLLSPKKTTVFCFGVCFAVGWIMAGQGGDLHRVLSGAANDGNAIRMVTWEM